MKRRTLVMLALLCGCGARSAQLKAQAASELGCTPEAVTSEDLGQWREHVMCNGQDLIYYYDGTAEKWSSPADRAAFDLSCEKDQLKYMVVGNLTVGVAGCGHKVTYVLTSPVFGQYAWVMNTESSKAGADEAPAKAAADADAAEAAPASDTTGE